MQWILQFQLYLFDLDGLLVNTEELHYKAYKRMLHDRGYHLLWDFPKYFSIAQQDAEAPKRYIYAEFPELLASEPDWSVLYAEKKKAYADLLETESAPLMPGVEELLLTLEANNKKLCVVTHSARSFVDALCRKNPLLSTIPYWISREDYSLPKPAPDGYLTAIQRYAAPGDKIIGFEDSSRGLRSLMATPAIPILINDMDEELRKSFSEQGVKVFKTFHTILDNKL